VWRPDDAHPEALIALRQGLSLQRVLKDAKSVKHESIVTFHNLRYDVYSQLANFDQNSGIKVCVSGPGIVQVVLQFDVTSTTVLK